MYICHTGVESKPIYKKDSKQFKTKQNIGWYIWIETYEHLWTPIESKPGFIFWEDAGHRTKTLNAMALPAGLQCLHRGQQLPRRGESLGGLQSRIETGHFTGVFVGKTRGNLPGNVVICWNILLDLSRLIFICQTCRGLLMKVIFKLAGHLAWKTECEWLLMTVGWRISRPRPPLLDASPPGHSAPLNHNIAIIHYLGVHPNLQVVHKPYV